MFSKIDLRNRQEMVSYLAGHYRYYTLSSWNLLDSFACRIKIRDLHLPSDLEGKAYDVIFSDTDIFSLDPFRDLINSFLEETGYTAGRNGRSGGHLVLYKCAKRQDEHKSFCTCCGQKNFQAATPENNRCGRCGENARINYDKPRYYYTPLSTSVGSKHREYYENLEISELREMTRLVQRFDKLCDDLRDAFIDLLKTTEVVEEEYYVKETRKVIKEAV